ncbi:MAG: Lpg1974 family pore-forming outer membrane protein [Rhodoplanes sp.]
MSWGAIMRKGSSLRAKRFALGVSASIAVLAMAAPAYAADLAVAAAPIVDRGEFRAYISGGAFWTGGDPVPYNGGLGAYIAALSGLFGGTPFAAGTIPEANPALGWDGAVGADYRFAGSPWHVNMQARFGQTDNVEDAGFASTFGLAIPDVGGGTSVNITAVAPTVPELKERHWQVDFGAGYDFLRGTQVNFGFRVAELKSDITASSNLLLAGNVGGQGFNASVPLIQTDRRDFLGAGPRIGIEGSIPLFGALSFDYAGDAALLFGNTKYSTGQAIGLAINVPTIFAVGLYGVPLNNVSWSAPTTVYNFDVEGGFAYWFTPYLKLGVSYRLDAFVNALRVAPDDGATDPTIGPGRSMDRFYHGPKATLTARF